MRKRSLEAAPPTGRRLQFNSGSKLLPLQDFSVAAPLCRGEGRGTATERRGYSALYSEVALQISIQSTSTNDIVLFLFANFTCPGDMFLDRRRIARINDFAGAGD